MEYEEIKNSVITRTEQAQGYVLACQSVANPKDKDEINTWLSQRYPSDQ